MQEREGKEMGNDESTLDHNRSLGISQTHSSGSTTDSGSMSPRNSVGRIPAGSRRTVVKKSPGELLFRRLHQEAQIPFNPDGDKAHLLILKQMWACFNREDVFKRTGKEWQAVGFQSPDPATDFRATGLMGAKTTKRFLEKNKKLVQYFLADVVMLESCLGDGVFYPLMANCIGVLVGICKLIGLAENSGSANLFKLRGIDAILTQMHAQTGSPARPRSKSPRNSLTHSNSASNLRNMSGGGAWSNRSNLRSFFKDVGESIKNIGQDARVKGELQLKTLFLDTRTFDLLLLHVIIQFHNNFMHDAIHEQVRFRAASFHEFYHHVQIPAMSHFCLCV